MLFSEYGPVATATIIRDRDDGSSKGFGFVEMENQADGERAIEALDGHEMMGRPLKVNPARPRVERRELKEGPRDRNGLDKEPGSPDNKFFHNPYTFVPTPPRGKAIELSGFAGDFNPLKKGLDHASLKKDLWTGHIPIKLTTVTPLVLLKSDDREENSKEPYDVYDRIPEPSLRGMLRSAYEVVTNSRYACFGREHKERLAYRMDTTEAPKLIPAIIKKGNKPGKLVAHLYTGTSTPTCRGPRGNSDERRAMYAAMLDKDLKYVHGGIPKTGDEVWAQLTLCRHHNPFYLYWKATKIWSAKTQHNKPVKNARKGHVFITNENIKKKHDERIFFCDNPIEKKITENHEKAWEKLIQNYRDAHPDDDIFKRKDIDDKPKEPWDTFTKNRDRNNRDIKEYAWAPHLYHKNYKGKRKDRWGRDVHDAMKLQDGTMAYARCKFYSNGDVKSIQDLFPVMISRELYESSPEDLLDESLRPAKSLCKLSPADRLFGWAPQGQGNDGGYKSRVRVICENSPPDALEKFNSALPLAILGEPKPAQGRFYVAKRDGTPQDNRSKKDAGYSKGKSLRGRKQYWHHKDLPDNYWDLSVKGPINGRYQEYRRPGAKKDSQNRSIKGWIKPGTKFKASLHVQNLQPEEIGALLWLLSLPEGHYFKLGYGKPLGFGSVKLEIDWQHTGCEGKCLPLANGKDWREYYRIFDADTSSLAKLDPGRREKYIKKFQSAMEVAYDGATFIEEFLQILRGPEGDFPIIHYPRLDLEPNSEGKNYEWFMMNENGRRIWVNRKPRKEQGKKCALPKVKDNEGIPYKPVKSD